MKIRNNFKKVYMIGIGGIGMSALARYFHSKGVEVVGSDSNLESEVVKGLTKEGITVIDQKNVDNYSVLSNMLGAECVIYTVAIPPENLELKTAYNHDLPVFTYAEMLGQISEDKFTIAVSGTHGKTTTTAMVAEIAMNLNLNPNVIVGSFLLQETGLTNFIGGDSDLFVVEACEYKRSFLNLKPNILVITNLEADHLDYYKDLADVKKAFFDLAAKVPQGGKIICDSADPNLKEICEEFADKIVDYSEMVNKIPPLKVFGEHNKQNAAAAVSAIDKYLNISNGENNAIKIKYSEEVIIGALKNFKGTWRRMEYKGTTKKGVIIYDDYGHHPTEIQATLKSFRENFKDKKIAVVFGPHLHSRTKIFFEDFVRVLAEVDHLIIYPIFKARAEDDYGVSSQLLVEEINRNAGHAKFLNSFENIVSEIEEMNDDWIVILLGAGEVYKVAEMLTL